MSVINGIEIRNRRQNLNNNQTKQHKIRTEKPRSRSESPEPPQCIIDIDKPRLEISKQQKTFKKYNDSIKLCIINCRWWQSKHIFRSQSQQKTFENCIDITNKKLKDCIDITNISINIASFLKKTDMRTFFTANSQINETYEHLKEIPEIQKKIAAIEAPERTWRRSLDVFAALKSNVRMNQIEPGKIYSPSSTFNYFRPIANLFEDTILFVRRNEDNRTFETFISEETISLISFFLYFTLVLSCIQFLMKIGKTENIPSYTEIYTSDETNDRKTILFMVKFMDSNNRLFFSLIKDLYLTCPVDTITTMDPIINIIKINNFDTDDEQSEVIVSNSTKLVTKLINSYLISEFLIRLPQISLTETDESTEYLSILNVSLPLPFILIILKLCYKKYKGLNVN